MMVPELASIVAFAGGAFIALFASTQAVTKAARLQQEIVKRGVLAQGRVLRVWRPPLFGSFTRVYFEFDLPNGTGPVRGCHIDRRFGEPTASLPAVGASVAVRYLPERPADAVIARLVSRLGN